VSCSFSLLFLPIIPPVPLLPDGPCKDKKRNKKGGFGKTLFCCFHDTGSLDLPVTSNIRGCVDLHMEKSPDSRQFQAWKNSLRSHLRNFERNNTVTPPLLIREGVGA
jgi:hypothetical protein